MPKHFSEIIFKKKNQKNLLKQAQKQNAREIFETIGDEILVTTSGGLLERTSRRTPGRHSEWIFGGTSEKNP